MLRCVLFLTSITTACAAPLALMPMPQKVDAGAGALRIDSGFRAAAKGYSDGRLESALQRLRGRLARQTGIPMPGTGNGPVTLLVECAERGGEYPALGEDESYQLDVTASAAHLQARTVTGVLRGLETFAQLVGPSAAGFEAPAAHIEDRPRFPWRGLMLDVARHWMPLPVVLRNLDAMAAVKLNVFHWHLSDDQGFRVESKRYPRLHLKGSDGHYYTQAEVRQVVAYARDRGIRVIPEFDMPGHTTAWFVGYPELASAPGPYAIERRWGVFRPTMDPTREATYAFLDGLIGEMGTLFPDPYFHIGGDEVEGTQWKKSASIQAFATAHRIAGTAGVQGYFNGRVEKLLKKHGKTMIGWDEVLEPGLEPDTVIQSWRGQEALAAAAVKGYRSLLSFGYYLDHLDPAAVLYANDPLGGKARELTPEQAAKVLGGEACMWAEYVSSETVESRVWPRAAAIAERLWSAQDVTDVASMYSRMEAAGRLLEWVGVAPRTQSRLMLDRLAAGRPAKALQVLADASEALGMQGRRHARTYTSLIPLNRFVDAVPPESELARRLEGDIRGLSGGGVGAAELRSTLAEWAANESQVRALATDNSLLTEVVPLAHNLTIAGNVGLEALDYAEKGKPAPAGWLEERGRQLDGIEAPVAEVKLAAVRAVRLLLAQIRVQTLAIAGVRCGNEPRCNGAATVPNWTSR